MEMFKFKRQTERIKEIEIKERESKNLEEDIIFDEILKSLENLKMKQEKEKSFYFKESIISDGKFIKDQQIEFLLDSNNKIHIYFYLKEDIYKKIFDFYNQKYNLFQIKHKKITYNIINGKEFELCNCWEESIINPKTSQQDCTIKISTGFLIGKTNYKKQILSSLGLVEIIIPSSKFSKEILKEIEKFFNQFGIDEIFRKPSFEEELEYKEEKYKEHYKLKKIDNELYLKEKVKKNKVLDDYYTLIEEGKYKEYQKITKYLLLHEVTGGYKSLINLFKTKALLSSHERLKKGFYIEGLSLQEDLRRGGADNVFLRAISKDSLEKNNFLNVEINSIFQNIILIFEPDILDRLDWYAYLEDQFGSKEEEYYKNRILPDEFFKNLSDYKNLEKNFENEIMFSKGIGIEKIKFIVCPTEEIRELFIKFLEMNNIKELNGKPINDTIIYVKTFEDLFKIYENAK